MRRLSVVFVLALALVGLAPASYAAAAPTVTGIAPRSGPVGGGQSITLVGTGLSGTTSVLFGSVRTTHVTVVSDTRLTVTTPAHGAGRVYVRATTGTGTSPQAEAATYIFVSPPPDLALGGATAHPYILSNFLSCASATFCAHVGANYVGSNEYTTAAMTWNGTRWSAFTTLLPADEFFDTYSLSCAATPTRSCMLVGLTSGKVWHYDGSSWTPTTIGDSVRGVSCPTSTSCQLISSNGDVRTWNGSAWSSPTHVAASLTAISCPTTSFCQAVTGDSPAQALTWRSGVWSSPAAIVASGRAQQISCSSAGFCMVSGDFGPGLGYLVWTGTAWSPPQPGPTEHYETDPADCSSPTFCLRANTGNETTFELWNGVTRVLAHPHNSDAVVSCWAAYSCLVFGLNSSRLTAKG